jgi:hypothetical protein
LSSLTCEGKDEEFGTMYDEDHHKIIAKLIKEIGSREKCLQLEFLGKDDNETLFLTAKGFGYLLDVVAGDLGTLAEAYEAGFEQGALAQIRA